VPVSREQLDTVFNEVAKGKSLRSQLDRLDIHYEQFYRQIEADKELGERYARARKLQAESSQNRILDAVDRVLGGDLDPNAARVAIDALKWNAARMHPAIYSEKTQLELSGEVGIKTINVHRGTKARA
jgi:hypothetical protein